MRVYLPPNRILRRTYGAGHHYGTILPPGMHSLFRHRLLRLTIETAFGNKRTICVSTSSRSAKVLWRRSMDLNWSGCPYPTSEYVCRRPPKRRRYVEGDGVSGEF